MATRRIIALILFEVLGHQPASAVAQSPNLLEVMFAQLQQTATSASNIITGNYFMSDASQLVLIFPLTPLEQSPTPPTGYSILQMRRWNWLGGLGFLVLTRNNFGEHGVLTELMYFPGLYQPRCVLNKTVAKGAADAVPDAAASLDLSSLGQASSAVTTESGNSPTAATAGADDTTASSVADNSTAASVDNSSSGGGLLSNSRDEDVTSSNDGIFSAQRFWVDMQVSQAVGRAYFGYPKEPATFQWTADSVTARDKMGNVFFSAKFGDTSRDADMVPGWVTEVANGKLSTVQWPINDPLTRLLAKVVNEHAPVIDMAINKLPKDVQKMLRAGAAAAQVRADDIRRKEGIKFLPNTQSLSFPGYSQLAAAQEPATFQWTADSVTARDKMGNVFFSAKFGDTSRDADMVPGWVTEVANGKLSTVQWPINDPLTRLLAKVVNEHAPVIDMAINKLPKDVQKMLRAGAAAAQVRADDIRRKEGIKFLPNTQSLSFPGYSQLAAAQVTKVFFNNLEFTGHVDQSVGLATGSAGIIVGTPGALSDPLPYSCY